MHAGALGRVKPVTRVFTSKQIVNTQLTIAKVNDVLSVAYAPLLRLITTL